MGALTTRACALGTDTSTSTSCQASKLRTTGATSTCKQLLRMALLCEHVASCVYNPPVQASASQGPQGNPAPHTCATTPASQSTAPEPAAL